MPRPWTPSDLVLLRERYGKGPIDALAARLGRTLSSVRSKADKCGLGVERAWTPDELAILRERYPTATGAEVAALLPRRSATSVFQQAVELGLTKRTRVALDADALATLCALNAEGTSDTDIAARLGCDRSAISRHRKRLGLPSHAKGRTWRASVLAGHARQLEAAGAANLGEVRGQAYRAFARRRGWPEDLRPRAVQILELMSAVGLPMSRREIVEALGMAWHGSRASLKCRGPRGSYLAELAARGLVLRMLRGRTVSGQGKGHSCDLYCLGPEALAILERRAAECRSDGE